MFNVYNSSQGFPLFILAGTQISEENNVKLNEDRYELYVNNDYVGSHTMFLQKEDANAVSDFLHAQGFRHVNLEVNGDHIIVHTDSQEEAQQMERALEVYVQNR
ncbi:MAG: hypothetical protein LRY73_05815 [Bacillus sp. (in: Bacteria)]|nr:hypothetical protein [Bacillus sp. (in: firmicutes)]